ncbi:hypothetical protein PLESTB_001018100 [Pleodorina starrii]|uniref:Uncharacterized protein n=1 Tax=Pleodorina starrii TaxID=330485 RepID=A0A9W6BQ37_9CHLO|nr:hypothetical protein PLESTM_001189500 [Pleodorina starrii]GLC55717.1 hypothetical protein PLESTB_001018100 [Pleodorina starrii]
MRGGEASAWAQANESFLRASSAPQEVCCGGNCCGACCCYCIMHGLSLCCFLHCAARSWLRHKYNIPGDPCQDCCTTMCCPMCAMCQEHRELVVRGHNPGGKVTPAGPPAAPPPMVMLMPATVPQQPYPGVPVAPPQQPYPGGPPPPQQAFAPPPQAFVQPPPQAFVQPPPQAYVQPPQAYVQQYPPQQVQVASYPGKKKKHGGSSSSSDEE